MTSTFKSLIFWLGLVVVGVLIWQFAGNLQHNETDVSFTEFMKKVGHEITDVTISGNEIVSTPPIGDPNAKAYRTYFEPNLYEGLANKLRRRTSPLPSKPETAEHVGDDLVFVGADSSDDRLLDFHHAADAERRQQSPLIRQEPREALVEHPEKSDVQGRRRC